MQTRVVLIPLCVSVLLSSDGSATAVVLQLDTPKIRSILPYANSLVLYTLTEGMPLANELEISVQFRSGFDRDHEVPGPVALTATAITTSASIRHPAVELVA
jgi:hypothetical protein